jgi:general secretion pathway protein K
MRRSPITLWLGGSSDGSRRSSRARRTRRRGVALVIAITAVAILGVMLADMHRSTTTGYVVATTQRDSLRAEYMAKSGLNLTRLLVAQEPAIRQIVAPLYRSLVGRPPPQLPVWRYANLVLRPFCHSAENEEVSGTIDFRSADGLADLPGTCDIVAFAENSKINLNQPLLLAGDQAKLSLAMQIFAMMGGYQSPSPYDALFGVQDEQGQFNTRQDIVSAIIDWWDEDLDQLSFDPGASAVSTVGSENDVYRRFDDPYSMKNAPFDSLEEIRLIRGVDDDFWATFIEPNPENPESRVVTVYGSGMVNPNEAPPEVLHARICSFLISSSLCVDPMERARFVGILRTTRDLLPVPFFSRSSDFLNFIEGKGTSRDLYPMLASYLGTSSGMLFTPVEIPATVRGEMNRSFVTSAQILTIEVTGTVNRAKTRLRTVMNFHDRWTPPPPLTGTMPGLGVFHYYRVE